MWAAGRLGQRARGGGPGPSLQRLGVQLEESTSCFRRERPTRMPATGHGTRAGARDWTMGPTRPAGAPGAGQPHQASGKHLSGLLPSRGGEDPPRVNLQVTRAGRRREDQNQTAAPPH